MSKPVPRLARGLSALISAAESAASSATQPHPPVPASGATVAQIPVDRIRPNPRQPRTSFDDATLTELAESIRAKGIIQPVLVRAVNDGYYELVAGERRWRAAKIAGLASVPAIVMELSDAESLETALIENLQREDLGPLERASAYQRYLEFFGGTIENLAQRLGESRASITNHIRLLKLHPEVCYMLGRNELGMGQARAIAGLADQVRQLAIARLAVRRNLSVRQVEELARRDAEHAAPASADEDPAATGRMHHLKGVEEALSKALGLRVRITAGRRKNSGRVIITFATLDDFDRIAERMGASARLE